MMWYKFAKDINQHRLAFGTYVECENASGVPASAIHRVCSGCKVDFENFERLCIWAKLNPLDYLNEGWRWKRN